MDSVKLSNYIKLQTVRNLWFGCEEMGKSHEENRKAFRIISYHFLNMEAHSSIQLAKKIRDQYKAEHHKKIREILKVLR